MKRTKSKFDRKMKTSKVLASKVIKSKPKSGPGKVGPSSIRSQLVTRITIGEKSQGGWDRSHGDCELQITQAFKLKKTRKGGELSERSCAALAAVGHVQRAKILRKLLEGPVTYQALQKHMQLKAGPLYHHISELRLTGLMLPKQRDLYEITRGGRNLILGVMVLAPMVGDKRRRLL